MADDDDDNYNPVSVSPLEKDKDGLGFTPELFSISPVADQKSPPDIDYMLREFYWRNLKKRLLTAKINVCKSNFSEEVDSMSKEVLEEKYKELKDELLENTALHDSKELLLKGWNLNQTTIDILESGLIGEQNPRMEQKKSELNSLLEEFTILVSQVSKEHQENTVQNEKLEKIKKENFALLKKSRELYLQIEDKKKAKDEELKSLTAVARGESMHEKLQEKRQLYTIQNSIFQGLILGSGINWAQDSGMLKLMLNTGTSGDSL